MDQDGALVPFYKFCSKLASILDKYSVAVRSLLFRVSNEEKENPLEDPYLLGILVLYSLRPECLDADSQAKACAHEIDELFARAFYRDEVWTGIEIEYCDPVSDEELRVAQHEQFKQWRLDYLSLAGERTDAFPADL